MKYLVILEKENQLCNRLFLAGHMIGFCTETGSTLINLGFPEYAALFPSTSGDLLCRYPAGRLRFLPRNRFTRECLRLSVKALYLAIQHLRVASLISRFLCIIQSGYESTEGKTPEEQRRLVADLSDPGMREALQRCPLVLVLGPLVMAPALFAKHAGMIRRYFTPSQDCLDRVAVLAESLRGRGSPVIGVHIRQGDYRTFEGGRYYYSDEQYLELMLRVKRVFADACPVFLVCSDEPKQPGQFPGVEMVAGTGRITDDLYALSRCDYLMGPPSTFSGWAAFYGRVPAWVIRNIDETPGIADFQHRHDIGRSDLP